MRISLIWGKSSKKWRTKIRTRIKSCIAFIIKKKNHLRRKLTTIKFWDKKWRVLWRIFEAWKSAIPLGRFSFLPSPGNRVGSAQVAKTKFITPCQLSHTYFRGKIRVTRVSGERSRAQWCIPWFPVYERRCRVSLQFYYRSMRDRGYCHKFIAINYCSKRYFCIQIVWKEIIEIRNSNHNSQD